MQYVGLDVHKRIVRVCILDNAGQQQQGFNVSCTHDDLKAFCIRHMHPDDHVVLEATSNTWAVVDIVTPYVARVVVSNPLRTKAIAQAKIKTDEIDAEVLAQLLRCDYLPEVWTPDQNIRRLRQLTTLRTSLTGDRTRIKNRIQSLLAGRLIRCPYATLFAQRSLAWLRSLELDLNDRAVLDSQLRLLEVVEREIASLDERLQRIAHDHQKAKLLMTLPGVSHATAVALLAAIGTVSRFRDGDHAASYLGLVPSTRQSASRCYHGRITKAGNTHARWMLTQGVQHLSRHPGPLGSFFRRIARCKSRQVAVVATARKLVTIAYLMLKNNEPYRYAMPGVIDRKYRKLSRTVGRETPRRQTQRTYAEICRDGNVPPPTAFDDLPAGERRVLAKTGAEVFARQVLD